MEARCPNLTEEIARICSILKVSKLEDALYFPRFFQIEPTRLCNAHCPYCALSQWDKSTAFMPDQLFEKIATELEGFADWIEAICLTRAGEPLLDKTIADKVKRLKSIGIKRVNIVTNAALLNDETARKLLNAGLDEIMFSIDSIHKEDYEKAKIGLNFETVMGNALNFFKLRDEIRPSTIIRVRAVSFHHLDVETERKQMIEWEAYWGALKKSQDRVYMKKPHSWGNQKVIEGYEFDKKEVFHPCVLPWSTIHVTAMGTATLCPMDFNAEFNLGNVNEQSIKELWLGDKISKIRELHLSSRRNEISFCNGCVTFDPEASLDGKV